MHEHGVDDDLLGNAQELLVERAHQHRGLLAEVHDLVEDLRRRVDAGPAALGLDPGYALCDHGAATVLGQDAGGLEHGLVGGRLGDDVLAGSQDAVAAGRVAGLDAREAHRHDLVAQKDAQPADGTDERLVRGAPALAAVVGPFDGRDDLRAERREDGRRGRGGDAPLGEDVLAAVRVLAADEVGGVDAALAGEALGRLGGGSLGVEGDGRRRAALHLVHLLGRGGDVGDEGGETARRGDDADIAVRQAGLGQTPLDQGAELPDGVDERCGGHLLAADLE